MRFHLKIRDRIVELRRVPARDLIPNPKNWRTHPKAQQEAMQGILAEIGYADALLARETDAGLQVIDGHLRAEITPDQEVPVLVLDLNEEEADKLLASLDPLAAMAGKDDNLLRDLLSGIETDSDALRSMFDDLVAPDPTTGLTDPDDVPELPDEPVPERYCVRAAVFLAKRLDIDDPADLGAMNEDELNDLLLTQIAQIAHKLPRDKLRDAIEGKQPAPRIIDVDSGNGAAR